MFGAQVIKPYESRIALMHTQNMAIRLSLYLSSQSICIVDFGFPTMGGPMLGDPSTLLFL